MYLKLTYLSIIILFSEKNNKEQAQRFYQNHTSALHTVEIFFNLISTLS